MLIDWTAEDAIDDDDDSLGEYTCEQKESFGGNFVYQLYDLINDPYETNNLYDDSTYASVLESLYSKIGDFEASSVTDIFSESSSTLLQYGHFKSAGGYVVPWDHTVSVPGKTAPVYCAHDTSLSPIKHHTIHRTSSSTK